MNEDPMTEATLQRAVDDQELAPHPVHAPPHQIHFESRTYNDPGDRPPDGQDEQSSYWMIPDDPWVNGLMRCPDCGQILISAQDNAIARVGMPYLGCLDLGYPLTLPERVRPCHRGCVIACGRTPSSRPD